MQPLSVTEIPSAVPARSVAWESEDKIESDHLTDVVPDGNKATELFKPPRQRKSRETMNTRKTGLFDFSNVEAIKDKVREQKRAPDPYDVCNFYHKQGLFQWVAKHALFENTTLAIIVINALWISVDTDFNHAETLLDAKPIFVAADVMFFSYFCAELFVRFMAFKRKFDCLKDGWFKFDFALVTLYAFDPFTIGIVAAVSGGGGLDLPTALLRLFRLARLSRLVRMFRSLPQLMVMIKGMITATSTVGYVVALLMMITYIFAIAFVNLADKDTAISEDFFSTVPETMHNLIIYGCFLDALSDFVLAIKEDSWQCFLLVWCYIAIASLTVLNMLIGVLCEVVSAVAAEENESMMFDSVHEQFGEICRELDDNDDGFLSWTEFQSIIGDKAALKALDIVGIDAVGMIDAAEDFFFEDGEEVRVSFDEFMAMLLDMRKDKTCTVQDLMNLSKRLTKQFISAKSEVADVRANMLNMESKVDNLDTQIRALHSKLDLLVEERPRQKTQT